MAGWRRGLNTAGWLGRIGAVHAVVRSDSVSGGGEVMESFFPFVLLGLAVGLLIWGVSNLSVQERYTKLYATIATAVGVAVLGWFFMTYGKGGPLYAVFSGLLLVGLLVWGLINPVVGRRLARIFAVIAMGLGMALLLWGFSGAVSGQRLRPTFGSNIITEGRAKTLSTHSPAEPPKQEGHSQAHRYHGEDSCESPPHNGIDQPPDQQSDEKKS